MKNFAKGLQILRRCAVDHSAGRHLPTSSAEGW